MKTGLLHIFFIILILQLAGTSADAASAAFGFFTNRSGNESLDYLEKILPNSFAGALKNKYKFSVIKPGQITALSPEENGGAKREIKEDELKTLTESLGVDYFIYGSFTPVEDNRIKLVINIYKNGAPNIFQFDDSGYLATEIFKLVDKIAAQIKNITDDAMIYKKEPVSPKSKLAILTNVEGEDLNSIYCEFLKSGYKLSPTQGNELHSLIDFKQIKKFYHFGGVNASFHLISNRNDAELFYGTWSGTEYYRKMIDEEKAFEQYAFNYMEKQNGILKKIKSFTADPVEYILIIGFSEAKDNAWIRCLNLKDNRLIIMETGIDGSTIDEITMKIIASITTGLPPENH